jgi:hypothetical protein
MDVRIDELHSTIDAVGADALLTPEVLRRIVAAVRAEIEGKASQDAARDEDLDTRSVVAQQRAGRR